jgi:hypothetical protein
VLFSGRERIRQRHTARAVRHPYRQQGESIGQRRRVLYWYDLALDWPLHMGHPNASSAPFGTVVPPWVRSGCTEPLWNATCLKTSFRSRRRLQYEPEHP